MSCTTSDPNDSITKREPPQFLRSLTDVIVPVGSKIRFVVEVVSATNQLKVTWSHNDNKFKDNKRVIQLHSGNFFCLDILQATPVEQGKWTCLAENSFGGTSCSSQLNVSIPNKYRAPEFSLKKLIGYLYDNGTLSLQCECTGNPTPSLRWYKDGKEIKAGDSLTLKASSKELENCIGVFCVEAFNEMGSKYLYAKVYAKNFCDFLTTYSGKSVSSSTATSTAHMNNTSKRIT